MVGMRNRSLGAGIVAAALLVVVLFYVWNKQEEKEISLDADLTAVAAIGGSFGELGEYFGVIAREKSGVYAFSVLRNAALAPNIDVHLLAHVIGDEMYKQEGLSGMQYCTPEFRNACSHTVVIGSLLEMGDAVFDSVNDVCHLAPGGRGAYTMCFHGFGHGVLAYNDYEVPDAVEMCKKTGTKEYRNREYVECVGGLVMEMMAGVHDRAVWKEKAKIYLDPENPLSLCSDRYMDEEVQGICYVYATPALFEAAGANLGSPDPSYFDQAFEYCNVIEEDDLQNRNACYGGFGKEFIVLVQDRDIRDFSKMTDEQLDTVVSWCAHAGNEFGEESCIMHALNSLYWGGENSYSVPVRFCNLADEKFQGPCLLELTRAVEFYAPTEGTYRDEYCGSLPSMHQSMCSEILL